MEHQRDNVHWLKKIVGDLNHFINICIRIPIWVLNLHDVFDTFYRWLSSNFMVMVEKFGVLIRILF